MVSQLIDRYEQNAGTLITAVSGLSAAQLDACPGPGRWSIRQVIMHLVDSDLIASDRMKRVIAEDNPTVVYSDESLAAQHLPYQGVDLHLACEIFEKNRRFTAQMLRALPPEAFERYGTHSRSGRMTLAQIVQTYVDHVPHHLKFVAQKRARLAAPAA